MVDISGVPTSEDVGTPAVFLTPSRFYKGPAPIIGGWRPPSQGMISGIHAAIDLWPNDAWLIPFQLFAPDAQTRLDMSAPGTTASWTLNDVHNNIVVSLSLGSGIAFSGEPSSGWLVVIVPQTVPQGIYWDR